MDITPELVRHMAELSRLELGEEEARETAALMERVLGCMDVLDKLDTADVEPMSHVFPVKNVLREDEAAASQDRAELLAGSPASGREAFLVPKTVE